MRKKIGREIDKDRTHGPIKVICRDGERLERPEEIEYGWMLQRAGDLRQASPASERLLLPFMLAMGFQHSVALHGYIADFYHPIAKIDVEIDGAVHRSRKARDRTRDRVLYSHGIRVYRWWARGVFADTAAVAQHIQNLLTLATPIPPA